MLFKKKIRKSVLGLCLLACANLLYAQNSSTKKITVMEASVLNDQSKEESPIFFNW